MLVRLGYISLEGRGETDVCLAEAVERIRAAGQVLAGTVQSNPRRADRTKCDMDLHLLPDGPVLRISQDLGNGARGCRLDGGVLETAVAEVARRIDGAALVVVNKFGKQESLGRGFVPVIAAALDRGLPVLVGVNRLNLGAFLAFAGELAVPLPADPAQIARWALSQTVAAD